MDDEEAGSSFEIKVKKMTEEERLRRKRMQEKIERARLEAVSKQAVRHVALETAAFECPVPGY